MIRFALGLLILAGFSAYGETEKQTQYRVEAKIFEEGKLMSSPTIVALDAEEATVSQESTDSDDFMTLEVFPLSLTDKTLHISAKLARRQNGESYNFGFFGEIESGKEIQFTRLDTSNKPVRVVLKVDRL